MIDCRTGAFGYHANICDTCGFIEIGYNSCRNRNCPHTWPQTLTPHIHIHFIVTAGGLTEDGKWVEPKHGKKFSFPVRALAAVFRGKVIEGLKALYYNGKLVIPDSMDELETPEGYERKLDALVSKSWRVNSKPPFSGPEEVVRYIERYTHRTAISESRIISVENRMVTFSYKDNREKDPAKKRKEMTLPVEEFMRRFLYRILPNRYHRIRNYGFFANGKKKQNIEIIKNQLPETEAETSDDEEEMDCPMCEKGRMISFWVVDGIGRTLKFNLAAIKQAYADTS